VLYTWLYYYIGEPPISSLERNIEFLKRKKKKRQERGWGDREKENIREKKKLVRSIKGKLKAQI
jgi:hypothetical protein